MIAAPIDDLSRCAARGRCGVRVIGRLAGGISADDGNSAIELAILAPVILLVLFGFVQFALVEYGRNVALSSAREAASTLRLSSQADCEAQSAETVDDTKAYAHSLASAGLADPVVTPTCGADEVSVTVSGHAVSLVPGLTITVTRRVDRPVEKFVPDDSGAS